MDQMIVSPGPGNSIVDEYGNKIKPPSGWSFLPAGDAGLTRKVTSKGKFWRVQFKKGKRTISKGIWAPSSVIEQACEDISDLRKSDTYKKKREGDLRRRQEKQNEFVGDFVKTVQSYLNFAPKYKDVELVMAVAIAKHATPVGSGTVARSSKLTISEKASRATIAWMRHQTTAYDLMQIPKVKGARREVRRMLAQKSIELLADYRSGAAIQRECPLKKAVMKVIETQKK